MVIRYIVNYRNTDTWLRDGTGWHLLAYQALALRTDPPSIALSETEMANTLESTPLVQ
jgi:hypothetical protein